MLLSHQLYFLSLCATKLDNFADKNSIYLTFFLPFCIIVYYIFQHISQSIYVYLRRQYAIVQFTL